MNRDLVAVALAAGLGKRMKSDLPKVLHPVCGRPMIDHVLDALEQAGAKRVYAIVGHRGELVREHVGARAVCIDQPERLGTGHAVSQAREALKDFRGDVLIVCGDTPLIRAETLRELTQHERRGDVSGVVLATRMDDPFGYGRVIRDEAGRVLRIVEQKDTTADEAAVHEINTGVYCVDCRALFDALGEVKNDNAQGEYYLTDIVEILARQGRPIEGVVAGDSTEVVGINSRKQLAEADRLLRLRWLDEAMDAGVSVVDPETTFIDRAARFGRDVIVHPFSAVRGASAIGDGAQIGPGTEIRSSTIGARARIVYSWIEEAEIGAGEQVGPYRKIIPEGQ
ncbi:MAG: NTP transferase domain-containing protein [Candidatus Sumerlaeota bacterium]|nr:NTP transferase domain-containing protein [Candidatus Sumerlaeota bacterium]